MSNFKAYIGLLISVLLLSACANELPKQQITAGPDTGLIADYGLLTEVKNPSGNRVLRRVSKDFTAEKFPSLFIEPVSFYPTPEPTDQISRETLSDIRNYFDRAVRDTITQNMSLASSPGEGVAIVSVAFISVESKIASFKPQEAIPLKAVIAGINYATGGRDFETDVVIEMQVKEYGTGKILAEVAIKGKGMNLENAKEKLTVEHLKPLFEKWLGDANSNLIRFNQK